jgi:hypothetical protein
MLPERGQKDPDRAERLINPRALGWSRLAGPSQPDKDRWLAQGRRHPTLVGDGRVPPGETLDPEPTAQTGASRPLRRIPAIVSFLNHSRHSALSAGTALRAPEETFKRLALRWALGQAPAATFRSHSARMPASSEVIA